MSFNPRISVNKQVLKQCIVQSSEEFCVMKASKGAVKFYARHFGPNMCTPVAETVKLQLILISLPLLLPQYY